jgi:hypothetical protein
MFGDLNWSFHVVTGPDEITFQANTTSVGKIAENGSPLPKHRAYVAYNHFHNAVDVARFPLGGVVPAFTDSSHVDRYTLGWEKTWSCDTWSVELRLPLSGGLNYESTGPVVPTPDLFVDEGNLGDLTIILKRLLFDCNNTAISAGLGITTPTGNDLEVELPLLTTRLVVHNDAVHLLPFVGVLSAHGERLFFQGFAQVDVSLNGDRVDVFNATIPAYDSGLVNDQTLIYLDAGLGYWLWSDPCNCGIQGVASVMEIHYTTTLEDADIFSAFGGLHRVGNQANRMDIVNVTVGLHTLLSNGLEMRVGTAFPFDSRDDRLFDAEVMASLVGRF